MRRQPTAAALVNFPQPDRTEEILDERNLGLPTSRLFDAGLLTQGLI
jgi:hypothetical protein